MTNQFPTKNLEVFEVPRIIRVQTYKDVTEGRLENIQVEIFYQDVLVPVSSGLNGDAISKGDWQSIVLESNETVLTHIAGLGAEAYRQILESKAPQSENI